MTKCHCGKHAAYNIKGKKAIACEDHKDPTMTNVKSKKCEAIECNTQASYNYSNETKGRFCSKHKETNMIHVIHKFCQAPDCKKLPLYNNYGEKKAKFCSTHKESTMINIKSKKCEADNCMTQAKYNNPGKRTGQFCVKHKHENMINVTKKQCEAIGCDIQASYNIIGKKARFCTIHKESNMICVRSRLCDIDGCTTQASFQASCNTNDKRRFCSKHKEPNMIHISSDKCQVFECNTNACFNIYGQKPKFCNQHKESNMINVITKTCEINDCNTRPCYGLLGKISSHCAYHKQKGMISFSTKKCIECNQLGTYEANAIRYCEDHAPQNSQNLGVYPCTSCGLSDILTNGTCTTCDPTILQSRRLVKEYRVKDLLKANELPFIHNRILEIAKCGMDKPDFQIDCGTHCVYLEVDENQHETYPCLCEQTRMINLVEVRGMPVTFIRYNPDIYEPVKGQQIVTLDNREKKLIEYIKYAMKHSPMEMNMLANVIYLFYDEYDNKKMDWIQLVECTL